MRTRPGAVDRAFRALAALIFVAGAFPGAAAAIDAAAAVAVAVDEQTGAAADPSATEAGRAPIEVPSEAEVEDVLPEGKALTGKELYDRLLDNREHLTTVFQRGRIESKDPGGSPQETFFWLIAMDSRDENEKAVEGVRGKSMIKVTGPYEMRHTGYLHIQRDDRSDEQFIYSPNRGRTSRVSLEGQRLAGTDFSFDDFLVNLDDLEDADYKRLPDEEVQGVPCYVVEATMKPSASSIYSRSIVYMEKEHYVPLRARYWDDVGVEVKEMISPHGQIREFDGAWVPTESTVTDLLETTSSTVHVEHLEPNPPLDDEAFSISQLEFKP